MDNICKICNSEFSERSHFWKTHKLKEKDYYEKYFPKLDLFTQEKIEFKNPEQYELTNFNHKNNLKKYLESNTDSFSQYYLSSWLDQRQKLKNTQIAPSEFELKSLQFPSIKYLIKKYGADAYKKMCLCGFLKIRYDYNLNLSFDESKKLEFLVDTREQAVATLENIQIKALNYGDYTVENSKIFIERKSLNDFIGTLSKGFDRFKNELDRCVKDDGFLIVLIEEKYSNLLSFNYLPHCKKIKATPDFIMHRARELLNLYPNNIQMLAVDGRKESARVIEKMFKLSDDIKTVDLQFYYDKGLL
jgi:ERCC4 domain